MDALIERRPVLIACPFSEDLVLAGIDAESLDDLPPTNHLKRCRSCGAAHDWSPTEAALALSMDVPIVDHHD